MGEIVGFINKNIFGVGVPVLLILSGLFYCVRLRFFHFLHPLKVIKCLLKQENKGGVSSARAVTLALAGTLGVGNMVGVASAICLGGAGAVFWLWVSALVAMVLKYAEIVLAMLYRRFDTEGRPYGGAMYYIRALFRDSRAGKIIAGIFAFLCIINALSMGSMIQVNAAAEAMGGVFGIPQIAVGVCFAVVAFVAMNRGASGILGFTEKLVPFMTLGFTLLSVAVIIARPEGAARAVRSIFDEAFSLRSGIGGLAGFLLSDGLRYGTMRGIVSNEAGCGTAPAAHAVSSCTSPAKQGAWGIFEVFVDTILLCTLTAMVILIAGGGAQGDYMMLTISSYSSVLGSFAGYFLALAVLCFGFATVLCWGHYGMESVRYLLRSRASRKVFIFVYSASVMLGSVLSADLIWEAADLAIGAMTLINLCVLLAMSKEVKRETDDYFKLQ